MAQDEIKKARMGKEKKEKKSEEKVDVGKTAERVSGGMGQPTSAAARLAGSGNLRQRIAAILTLLEARKLQAEKEARKAEGK